MKKYCMLLVTVATVCMYGSASAATYTIDKRQYVSRSSEPYSAVIGLQQNGRNFCTGTLTADGIVVTAKHCIYDESGKRNLRRIRLNSANHGNMTIAKTSASDKNIYPDGEYDSTGGAKSDWALLVPSRSVRSNIRVKSFTSSEIRAIFFGVPGMGTFAQAVGYGALKILSDQEINTLRREYAKFIKSNKKAEDFNARKSKGRQFVNQVGEGLVPGVSANTFRDTNRLKMSKCVVDTITAGDMMHGCQTWVGDSGDPVFVNYGNKWYLYGVHVAGRSIISNRRWKYADATKFVFVNKFIDSYKKLVQKIKGK